MEWFTYPSSNYSQIFSQTAHSDIEHVSLRDFWVKYGLRRSLNLILLAHDRGLPHVLLVKSSVAAESGWRLPSGSVDAGMTDAVSKIFSFFIFRKVLVASYAR